MSTNPRPMTSRLSEQTSLDANARRKERAAPPVVELVSSSSSPDLSTPESQIAFYRSEIAKNKSSAQSSSTVPLMRRSQSNSFTSRATRLSQRQSRDSARAFLSDLSNQEQAFELSVAKSNPELAKSEFKQIVFSEINDSISSKVSSISNQLDSYSRQLANPNLSDSSRASLEEAYRSLEAKKSFYQNVTSSPSDQLIRDFYSGVLDNRANSLGQEASIASQNVSSYRSYQQSPEFKQIIEILDLPATATPSQINEAVKIYNSNLGKSQPSTSDKFVSSWQKSNPGEKLVYDNFGNVVGVNSSKLQLDIPISEYVKKFPNNNPLITQTKNLSSLLSLKSDGMARLESVPLLASSILSDKLGTNRNNIISSRTNYPSNKETLPRFNELLARSWKEAGEAGHQIKIPLFTITGYTGKIPLSAIPEEASKGLTNTLSAQVTKGLNDLDAKNKLLSFKYSTKVRGNEFLGTPLEYKQYEKDINNYNKALEDYQAKADKLQKLSGTAYIKERGKELALKGLTKIPTTYEQVGALGIGVYAGTELSAASRIPFINPKTVASFVFSKPITALPNLIYESIPKPTSVLGSYAKAGIFAATLPSFFGTAYLAEAIKSPVQTWQSIKTSLSTGTGRAELAGFLTGRSVLEKSVELGSIATGKITGTYAPVKVLELATGEKVRVVDTVVPGGQKVRILLQEGSNAASQKIPVVEQLRRAAELKGERFFVQVSPKLIPTKGGKFTINLDRGVYLSPEAIIKGKAIPQALTYYAEALGSGRRIGLPELLVRKLAGEELKLVEGTGKARPSFNLFPQAYPSYPKWVVDSLLGKITPKIKKIIDYYANRYDKVNEGRLIDFKKSDGTISKWTPDEFVRATIEHGKTRPATTLEIKIAKAMIQWSRDTKKGLVGGPELQKGLQPFGPEYQLVEPLGKTFEQVSPNFRQKFFRLLGLERGRQFTYVDGVPVEITTFKAEGKTKTPTNKQLTAFTKINDLLTGIREPVKASAERRPTPVRVRPLSLIIPARTTTRTVERKLSRAFERQTARRTEQVRTPERRPELRNFLTRTIPRVPERPAPRIPSRIPPRIPPRQPPRVPERTPPRIPPRVPERTPPRTPPRNLLIGDRTRRIGTKGIKKGRTRYQTLPTLTQQIIGFKGKRAKIVQTGYDIARII